MTMTATTETIARAASDLDRIDTADGLLDYITEAIGVTAAGIRRAALGVQKYEELGHDVEGLEERVSASTLAMLRRVAAGQLDPDLVVRFGQGRLLDRLGKLPISEQRRLARNEGVKVAEVDTSGGRTHRLIPALELIPEQWNRVLGDGHLRTVTAQASLIDARKAKPAAAPTGQKIGELELDAERFGAKFGRKFIPAADIIAMADLLRGRWAK